MEIKEGVLIPVSFSTQVRKGGKSIFPFLFVKSWLASKKIANKGLIGAMDLPIRFEKLTRGMSKKNVVDGFGQTHPLKVFWKLVCCFKRRVDGIECNRVVEKRTKFVELNAEKLTIKLSDRNWIRYYLT